MSRHAQNGGSSGMVAQNCKPGVRVQFVSVGWCTTHTWLSVARCACLMEHCSRRRSVTFLSSSTKRRIEAEQGRVPSLTQGRSSLTYPWDWPAFHWVDKLIYFLPDISPFRRAIDLVQGPSLYQSGSLSARSFYPARESTLHQLGISRIPSAALVRGPSPVGCPGGGG